MSNITLKKRKKVQKKSTRSSKTSSIEYSVKTKRRDGKYKFAVVENKDRTVAVYDFREKAKELADFHNKNQVWAINGGIPDFLLD